jgi:hypothetical protein
MNAAARFFVLIPQWERGTAASFVLRPNASHTPELAHALISLTRRLLSANFGRDVASASETGAVMPSVAVMPATQWQVAQEVCNPS